MAETLLSPGVLARENDQSQIQQQPREVGAAIVGPTGKGPVEIPTLVTSFNEYKTTFGATVTSASTVYSFLTDLSVSNYFQNGGRSMLVTRVVSESANWFPATSSVMITGSGGPTDGLSPFTLETIGKGEIMNTGETEISNGAYETGSLDNVRWEINSVNTASGTFTLLIRRGDDDHNNKVILEQYTDVNLDPESDNYISKLVGDVSYTVVNDGTDYFIQESGSYPNASRYVRVKAVSYKTPKYFDNSGTAKNEFTGSLPLVQSGSFNGGAGSVIPSGRAMNMYEEVNNTDSQGLTGGSYANAIALLANSEQYKYNLIMLPGLLASAADHATQLTSVINNCISRGDALAVVDLVTYNATISAAITQAASYDTSYAAAYWPWVQIVDANTSELVWVPASTVMGGVFAYTDASSEPWFAPAGIARGALGTVVKAERRLSVSNRDDLYQANINPIATLPPTGPVVYGNKTLQKRQSALDRVNVRRLLIALKGYIGQVANNLVFEQNTNATRANFLAQVNPYLDSVKQRQGLFAFRVIMDDTNNTADVIDRNQLIGQIFLQPTRTAEFILLDFNVTPTGATFDT